MMRIANSPEEFSQHPYQKGKSQIPPHCHIAITTGISIRGIGIKTANVRNRGWGKGGKNDGEGACTDRFSEAVMAK